jgi:hypothetical protein
LNSQNNAAGGQPSRRDIFHREDFRPMINKRIQAARGGTIAKK